MSNQCFRKTGIVVAVLWCLALANVGNARPAASLTNTLTFAESSSDKVACTGDKTDGWSCDLVTGDSLTISTKIELPVGAVANFDQNTSFDMSVGNFSASHSLGDDPKYVPGKTTATFIDTEANDKGKTVVYRIVRLKWTATQLTVTITGKTSDTSTSNLTPILAGNYDGGASGPISGTTSGSISFGTTRVTFDSVAVTGQIVTKHVTGKDGTAFSRSSVKIKGNGMGVAASQTLTAVHVAVGGETIVTNIVVNNQNGGSITVNSGTLAGITVVVPPGAVSGDTQFTVLENDATLTPNSGTFPGKSISLHTDGQTTFAEPLRITIPFPDDGTIIPVLYYVDTNNLLEACQVVSIDHIAKTISYETFHASLFTWINAWLNGTVPGGHTTYLPGTDGFQIVNAGSVYNPGGECFGMCAFEQWYFKTLDGGLYPKYMQDIPTPSGSVKGQNIIATRAHTSISRMWSSYWPGVVQDQNLTVPERFAVLKNMLDNTRTPEMLYLSGAPTAGTHCVLAYDYNDNGVVFINDPNHPNQTFTISTNDFTYGGYTGIAVIGDGTYQKESFINIYVDAEDGFNGNGAAQVNVTSHADFQRVTDGTATLSGEITSGQVFVDHLQLLLDEVTAFDGDVDESGVFSIPISLVSGTNDLLFVTSGHDSANNVIDAPNTQLAPFHLIYDNPTNSVILITLTWDTDGTDLDLYTIDPTGDYSCYYHKVTADGGQLDFDNVTGFGPEHWTLTGNDTIRWGEEYTVRVHYYDDHTGNEPGPAIPSRWTVTILLYEGTAQQVSYTYSGL